MPYVTTKEMLEDAKKNNYAVCAFNAENLEMVQAIVWGAEEMGAPVIIQTTPSTVKYADLAYFYAITLIAAAQSDSPVALHLDHGDSFELAFDAINTGYSSVMIDFSHDIIGANIAKTKKVVEYAQFKNIPVEAELGKIGGKEDDLESDGDIYTDPEQAAYFIKETEVSSLAVAIGTAHGIYKTQPKLDLDRLSAIRQAVDIPLVLHGATGLSEDIVFECIQRGINKVNFATELRQTYTNAVREKLESDKDIIDVKIYGKYARERVKELVKDKIVLSNSSRRASV